MLRGNPVAALVTQRPGYHRGVVAVAVVHIVHSVLHGPAPLLLLGQAVLAVALGVRFHIGLVPHIQTVAVAQLVPILVVGIMAGPHGIDVHVLHQHNVKLHLRACHILPRVRAVLMSVHPFDGNRHPIHAQLLGGENRVTQRYSRVAHAILQADTAILHISDLHIAEAYFTAYRLRGHAAGILQTHDEGVEVGGLRCPGVHLGNPAAFPIKMRRPVVRLHATLHAPHTCPAAVPQLGLYHHVARGPSGQVHAQLHQAVTVALVNPCHQLVIADMDTRGRINIHIARDAAHAPHVLALQIAPVAKAHHHHRHTVLAGTHTLGDVPFRGAFRIL